MGGRPSIVTGRRSGLFTNDGTSVQVQLTPPIKIQAAVTSGSFPGKYMFVQIVNTTRRSQVDSLGVATHKSNDTPSANPVTIDLQVVRFRSIHCSASKILTRSAIELPEPNHLKVNNFKGPLLDRPANSTSAGYPFDYGGSQTNPDFAVRAGQSVPTGASLSPAPPAAPAGSPTMEDSPSGQSVPTGYQGLGVTDTFSTYLMFSPVDPKWKGSWIAIAQVNWSWAANAIHDPVKGWPTDKSTVGEPAPTVQPNPAGGMEFPGWTNNSGNYLKNAKPQPGY